MADLGSLGAIFGGLAGGLAQGAEAGISLSQRQQTIELQKEQQKTQLLTSISNMKNMPLELRKVVLPGVLADFEKKYGIVLPDSYKKAAATFEDPNWKALTDSMVKNAPPGMDAQAYANWLGSFAGDPHAQLQAWDQYRKFRQGEDLSSYRQGRLDLQRSGTVSSSTISPEGIITTVKKPGTGTPWGQPLPAIPPPAKEGPLPPSPPATTKDDLNNPTTWVKSSLAALTGPQRSDFMKRLANDKDYQSAISAYKDDPTDEESKNIIQTKIRDHFNAVRGPQIETRGPGYEIQKPPQTAEAPPGATPPGATPPSTQPSGYLKLMLDYKLDPNKLPASVRTQAIMQAQKFDPNYDPAKAPARSAFMTSLARGGPQATMLDSSRMVVTHLQLLSDLSDAMKTGNVQVLNSIVSRIRAQTGNTAVTNAELGARVLGTEMARFLRGAGALSIEEERLWTAEFNAGKLSPDQILGKISTAWKAMGGRMAAFKERADTAWQGDFPMFTPGSDSEAAAKYLTQRYGPAAKFMQKYSSAPATGMETPESSPVATQPPKQAIDYLRQHPELTTQFEQKYGAGSAKRYLAQ